MQEDSGCFELIRYIGGPVRPAYLGDYPGCLWFGDVHDNDITSVNIVNSNQVGITAILPDEYIVDTVLEKISFERFRIGRISNIKNLDTAALGSATAPFRAKSRNECRAAGFVGEHHDVTGKMRCLQVGYFNVIGSTAGWRTHECDLFEFCRGVFGTGSTNIDNSNAGGIECTGDIVKSTQVSEITVGMSMRPHVGDIFTKQAGVKFAQYREFSSFPWYGWPTAVTIVRHQCCCES